MREVRVRSLGLRGALLLAPLLLASCAYPLYDGRDAYSEGMRRLQFEPAASEAYFAAAERDLASAIANDDLDTPDLVFAVTLRVRCLIELDRHAEVPSALAVDLRGFNPALRWRGDPVGLTLLRASRMDPDHGYAELVLAERLANTLRSREHIAWEQVHLLQKMGTARAKAEGVRICQAHAGQLDFDALKQSMSTP